MDGSDRQRGAEADGPGRVCILAVERPYVHHQGSSTYLDHLARSLALVGAEVHLRILQPPRRDQLRLRLEPDFLAPYASVALFGAVRRGAAFYARDPRNWLGPLRRRRAPPGGPWALLPARAGGRGLGGGGGRAARPRLGDRQLRQRRRGLRPAAGRGRQGDPLARRLRAPRRDAGRARASRSTSTQGLIAREALAFRAADLVLAIKPEEAAHVAARAPGDRGRHPALRGRHPRRPTSKPRGRRSRSSSARLNRPNVDALAWLLAEIWPRVRRARPEARLRVVGRVAGELRRPLARGGRAGRLRRGPRPRVRRRRAWCWRRSASARASRSSWSRGWRTACPASPPRSAPRASAPCRPRRCRLAEDAEGFAAAVAATLADPEPAAARAAARAAVGGGLRPRRGGPPARRRPRRGWGRGSARA